MSNKKEFVVYRDTDRNRESIFIIKGNGLYLKNTNVEGIELKIDVEDFARFLSENARQLKRR